MNCPICSAPMTERTLDGHMGTSVTIDLCLECQLFWFDGRESLRLSPGATLQLFQLIGEHAGAPRQGAASGGACPRCAAPLKPVSDMQRTTRFQYRACPDRHGRLTSFFDFLKEKDFIRPLSPEQIETLKRSLASVNCSNCGAAVDLAVGSACRHCGSALSMFDMAQAETLVNQLKQADRRGAEVDPALPLRMQQARREVETSFNAFDRQPQFADDVSAFGLVGAGLSAVSRWLKAR